MIKYIKQDEPKDRPIGEWKIGEGDYFISFALTRKPNLLRRFFAWMFFGLVWVDYEAPKTLSEIKPSKGVKVSTKVQGNPQRRFKG